MTEGRFMSVKASYLGMIEDVLCENHGVGEFQYYVRTLNSLNQDQLKLVLTIMDDIRYSEHVCTGAVRDILTKKCNSNNCNELVQPKIVNYNEAKRVTTVKWQDGTITQVRCMEDDDWDPEKALAMCFMKKWCCFNDSAKFHKTLKNHIPKPEEKIDFYEMIIRATESINKVNNAIGTYTKTEDENNA